jgi:hypothetical protein
VKRTLESDRRTHPRFPQILEIQAHEVLPLKSDEKAKPPVLGRVQNMSKGGVCFLSQHPVTNASLLRCEIGMSDAPLSVPTLALVRWTKKQNLESNSYLSGLQFLF